MPNLIWLRRDLRCHDNPALYHACQQTNDGVLACYFITPDIWQQHDEAPSKIAFWLASLAALKLALEKINIPLLIIETTAQELMPTFKKVLQEQNIHAVYFNKELEPDEQQRDKHIVSLCQQLNIKTHGSEQVCILPPGSVIKSDKKPYTVFTPFKNQWLKTLTPEHYALLPVPKAQQKILVAGTSLEPFLKRYPANYDQQDWPAGEAAAKKRLQQFIQQQLKNYDEQRDFPGLDATSRLSPYLAAGIISAKQCLQAALQAPDSKGKETWINELIWRDFYKHILCFFPRVGKHRAFSLATEKIHWQNSPEHFQAWCKGQTGIPIVDAAMRQLNQTGWMHNRLRMVCAMFLSKNLFLDWRLGEKYFMQHLLDGDLAANNGGWQWSASTGTDAAPYFRVFNPYSQSERFDPEGKFIRQYCPELAALDNQQIHQPPALENYPPPIVDVKQTRLQAIEKFKKLM